MSANRTGLHSLSGGGAPVRLPRQGKLRKLGVLLTSLVMICMSLVLISNEVPITNAAEPDLSQPLWMHSRQDGKIYGWCHVQPLSVPQDGGMGYNSTKFNLQMPDGQWVTAYCGNSFVGDSDHYNHAQPGEGIYWFVAEKADPSKPYGQTPYRIHVYSENAAHVWHWFHNRDINEVPSQFRNTRQWIYAEWNPKLLEIELQKEGETETTASLEGAIYTVRIDDGKGFDGQGSPLDAYIKTNKDGKGYLYRWDNGPTDERMWIGAGVNYVIFENVAPAGFELDPTHHKINALTNDTVLITRTLTSKEPVVKEPKISTSLSNGGKKTYETNAASVTLTDTVTYSSLTPNTKYVLSASLHYKDGDKDGGEANVKATKVFAPTSENGSVDVTLTFDPSEVDTTKSLVCFEQLRLTDDKDQPTGDAVATHEDITDSEQTVTPHKSSEPKIATTLMSENGNKNFVAGDAPSTVIDIVSYSGLTPGTAYKLEGTLHIKSDKDEDLGALEGVTATAEFTPTSASGSQNVTFDIPVGKIPEGTNVLVAFEKLYEGTKQVATHEDITDESQTISRRETDDQPNIQTILVTQDNKKNYIVSDDGSPLVVVDTVACYSLKESETYRLEGTIHAKGANGEDLGALEGVTATKEGVTATKEFVADDSARMTHKLTFTIPADKIPADAIGLVAFEKLYKGTEQVAGHEDITDQNQTVTKIEPPTELKIETVLTAEGGKKTYVVSDSPITVTDVVSYSGLEAGTTYRLEGTIHAKGADDEDLGALEGVTATAEFTPTSGSGTQSMTFTIPVDKIPADAIGLVAFEKLYKGTEETASATHEDITDENQTVTKEEPPLIMTILTTKDGQKNIDSVTAGTPIVLTDTVTYTGLEVGKEYELHGEIHAKDGSESGTLIEGSENVIKFTPETPDGSVTIELTVDPSKVSDLPLVAFEKLYLNGELVASHEDITDESQTVYPPAKTPSISTRLSTADGKKEARINKEQTITLVDEVTYKGLTPGKEYTLQGVLHERVGSADKGAVKDATGTVKFTPQTENGTVKVPIKVSVTKANKVYVAFEKLYLGTDVVATHEDINDEAQTFKVYAMSLDLSDIASEPIVRTGMTIGFAIAIGAIFVGTIGFLVASKRNRRI